MQSERATTPFEAGGPSACNSNWQRRKLGQAPRLAGLKPSKHAGVLSKRATSSLRREAKRSEVASRTSQGSAMLAKMSQVLVVPLDETPQICVDPRIFFKPEAERARVTIGTIVRLDRTSDTGK